MSMIDGQEAISTPLRALAYRHRFALMVTYSLFGLEGVTSVAQPFVLGLAIDGLLSNSAFGLVLLAGLQLLLLGLGVIRRFHDTRLFTRIASDLASQVVIAQRRAGLPVSQVSARATLSRQLVDFFERDLLFVFHCLVQGLGSVAMLALVAPALLSYSLVALAIGSVLGLTYGRFARRWTKSLHDMLERTVSVVARGHKPDVIDHYQQLRRTQVRFSDGEAFFFGSWQGLSLILTVTFIFQCSQEIRNAGQIAATLGYL